MFVIRRLSAEDLDSVYLLFRSAFEKDHMYNEYNLDIANFENIFKVAIDYSVLKGESFGVFLNNKLISFLLGFDYHKGFQNDKETMDQIFLMDLNGNSTFTEMKLFFEEAEKHDNLYYIMSIATSDEYRQQGLARLLLDTVIKEINQDLIGDVSSMITMSMYEKRNFVISTLGEDYKMVLYNR